MIRIHHVNLQPLVGGGEVYTRALTRAFAEAGADVTLYVHPAVRFWDDAAAGTAAGRVRIVQAANERELLDRLPRERSLVLTQCPITVAGIAHIAGRHRIAGFAHMPMYDGRSAEGLRGYQLVATVSRYCIGLLRRAGLAQVYPDPVYGTADVARSDAPVVRRSPYIVDPRKFRDVLMGGLRPFAETLRRPKAYEKLPGLTLGLVSLIAPIKQFPELFGILAPILAQRDGLRLEVFGAGGYAQVRDLRRALAPLGRRARFWGYQANVAAIYPKLDYLMTGLPEKEALGLNALEAQACGTPVLAPDGPPFTETVVEGASGFRYRDPREDGGRHFAQLLDTLLAGRPRPDPRTEAREHLAQFSHAALVVRAGALLRALSALE